MLTLAVTVVVVVKKKIRTPVAMILLILMLSSKGIRWACGKALGKDCFCRRACCVVSGMTARASAGWDTRVEKRTKTQNQHIFVLFACRTVPAPRPAGPAAPPLSVFSL